MKPIITIECINPSYPLVKGECEVGTINVYNSEFKLVKSVNVNSKTFFITLEDVPSESYVLTNVVGNIESEFSNIITKCKTLPEDNCGCVDKKETNGLNCFNSNPNTVSIINCNFSYLERDLVITNNLPYLIYLKDENKSGFYVQVTTEDYDVITNNQTKFKKLENDSSNLDLIQDLQSDINVLNSFKTNIELELQVLESWKVQKDIDVNLLNQQIQLLQNSINTSYATLQDNINALDTRLGGDLYLTQVDLNNTKTRVSNLESNVTNINLWKTQITQDVNALSGDLSNSINTTNTNITNIANNLTDLNNSVSVIQNRLDNTIDVNAKLKGVYYVPRLSKDNFWLTNWMNNEFTDADIIEDFQLMKNLLNVNTIRIFTFYDIEYRKDVANLIQSGITEQQALIQARVNLKGLTDGYGNYNQAVFDKLSYFIDLANQAGLQVLPTMFQELEALKATDNWTFLDTKIEYLVGFARKLITLFSTKENIEYVMLKNEPDGYGVWDNITLASKVISFLLTVKLEAQGISKRLKYIVNSTTHDNIFKKIPNQFCNSIYNLTDVVCINSFLFTDTGFWTPITYRTQFDYIISNNTKNKEIIMTECGFPRNYVNQRVEGEQDENGNISTITDESTVPINQGIFDRPIGRVDENGIRLGITHSEDSQYNAISEAIYWCSLYKDKIKGFLVWSAFDHSSTSITDSFAVINYDKTPTKSTNVIYNAYRNVINDTFGNRLSLQQGIVTNDGLISGLSLFDYTNPGRVVINGIRCEIGSTYTSDMLKYDYPFSYEFNLKYRNNVDEPFTLNILTNQRTFQLKYKKYTVNTFELYDLTNNISYGFCQTLNVPRNVNFKLRVDLKSNEPVIYYNNTILNFTSNLNIKSYELNNIRFQLIGVQSPVELHDLYFIGTKDFKINIQ